MVSTPVALGVCWAVGIVLGRGLASFKFWLGLTCLLATVMTVMLARRRVVAARCWVWLAVVAAAGAWVAVRQERLAGDDIVRYVMAGPQLVQLTGTVDAPPRLIASDRSGLKRFHERSPSTVFVLRAESIVVNGKPVQVDGRLWARIGEADHRLSEADRISVTGWLGPVRGPSNPGERDFRRWAVSRGIRGRVSLPSRANWQLLSRADPGTWRRLQTWVSQRASASLSLAMAHEPQRLAFLQAILLGRGRSEMRGLDEQFRRVGLAHLLAISGAHLGILLGLVWLVARCALRHPPRAVLLVLVVLAMYLLVVPPRVPIIRAAVMAVLLCVGYAVGRPLAAKDAMALAFLLVLIWRPGDLLTPGFQLSFGVVTGLLLFARRVSHWIYPVRPSGLIAHRWASIVARRAADYVSMNLVAFLIALPMVAYHFQWISPLAVVVSLLVLPVMIALLAVGYLKIVTGLVLPSLGVMWSVPLQWLADAMTGLVQVVSSWPGSSLGLSNQPSVGWTIGALAVTAAMLGGWFARRTTALMAAAAVCILGVVDSRPLAGMVARWPWAPQQPALKLNMFGVGNGSCYLVRLAPGGTQVQTTSSGSADSSGWGQWRGHVLMFDCGSQAYTDVGAKSIVPALRQLGVDRIDTLMVSHADMDHFNGSLAVMDAVSLGRVLVCPPMLDRARQQPTSAVRFFLDAVRSRGVRMRAIGQGWRETHGQAVLEILWPPVGLPSVPANDTSLVLSIRTAGRRLLLNGDIGQRPIDDLLETDTDLRADVCDLPHHGAWIPASPGWLAAVRPMILLQSSGPTGHRADRWASLLEGRPIQRLISDHLGMVELTIQSGGHIGWVAFKNPSPQWR